MDDGSRKIEDIMARTGLTEPEARAHYHLDEAYEALIEVAITPVVPDAEPLGLIHIVGYIAPHVDVLHNFLARRVLERERPEGWARPRGAQEEETPPG